MPSLPRGLYEELITEALEARLQQVGAQLQTRRGPLHEAEAADRIDIVMAFIRRSGIRPMMAALKKHTETGRPLRVLTTTYTGSTEERALDELQQPLPT